MVNIKCTDPDCFNHDEGTFMFCPTCLKEIAKEMTKEELYDIYLDCEAKLKQIAVEAADRDPNTIIEARMCKQRLFDMINDLMLLKD